MRGVFTSFRNRAEVAIHGADGRLRSVTIQYKGADLPYSISDKQGNTYLITTETDVNGRRLYVPQTVPVV